MGLPPPEVRFRRFLLGEAEHPLDVRAHERFDPSRIVGAVEQVLLVGDGGGLLDDRTEPLLSEAQLFRPPACAR